MMLPNLDRLGTPGMVGAGLLLFCLAFYLGSLAPARAELAALKSEAARLQAAAARSGGAVGDLATLRAPPPEARLSIGALPAFLKELDALAEKHGVTIDRASYALSRNEGQQRMEIDLPLKAGYPSLRAYLLEVLTLAAAPALDELSIKRQQAVDPVVEATVRLSFQMAPAS